MSSELSFEEAYNRILPLVEDYLDEYYSDEDKMPSFEEMQEIAEDLHNKLSFEHPELREYLDMTDDEEVSVSFFGCGGLLWLILVGVAFKKCGRKFRRCPRRFDRFRDFDRFKGDRFRDFDRFRGDRFRDFDRFKGDRFRGDRFRDFDRDCRRPFRQPCRKPCKPPFRLCDEDQDQTD